MSRADVAGRHLFEKLRRESDLCLTNPEKHVNTGKMLVQWIYKYGLILT